MVFLENVPRLLTSPAIHKGLNFAIVIRSLVELGYDVEWRTINAADYGMPQSRNRVFIIAYQSSFLSSMVDFSEESERVSWLVQKGPFAKAFPMKDDWHTEFILDENTRVDKIAKEMKLVCSQIVLEN